jgi:hypothetical protein
MKVVATRTLMLTLLTLAIASASAAPRAALTVRLYNSSAISPLEVMAAHGVADSILRDTGLNIRFRHCGSQTPPGVPRDACGDPLTPSEVVVRIIDAPSANPALRPDAYGVAYVAMDKNRGWLATVFSDRVGAAASRVGVEPGVLMGLVMAHEVGHLLLGSDYHSETGVMRANWPDNLLGRTAEQWRFSALEATRMQQAAALPF